MCSHTLLLILDQQVKSPLLNSFNYREISENYVFMPGFNCHWLGDEDSNLG